jgi:hypothetical protein
MDPLCSLHYYAPVCAIINACFLPFTEGLAPFRELARVGFFVMSTNALIAFGLNVAAVFLIGAAGGLVLTLAGVFKVCSSAASETDLLLGHPSHFVECHFLRQQHHPGSGLRLQPGIERLDDLQEQQLEEVNLVLPAPKNWEYASN